MYKCGISDVSGELAWLPLLYYKYVGLQGSKKKGVIMATGGLGHLPKQFGILVSASMYTVQ